MVDSFVYSFVYGVVCDVSNAINESLIFISVYLKDVQTDIGFVTIFEDVCLYLGRQRNSSYSTTMITPEYPH